jgi:adenylate cyclase
MAYRKVKFPIGVKLSLIISILLVVSLSVITVLVSFLVSSDVRLTAENNNWTMNRWSAAAADNILAGVKSRALLLIRNIDSLAAGEGGASLDEITGRFYRLNPDIACVAFVGSAGLSSGIFINGLFGPARQFSGEGISSWLEGEAAVLGRAAAGETVLLNGFPHFNIPFLVMLFPLPPTAGFSFSGAAAVFFSAESLDAVLRGNETTAGNVTFMVNGAGDTLIHPEGALVRSGENLAALPIVKQAIESGRGNLQTLYTDGEGVEFFGAFQRVSGGFVVTGIRSRIVFEGINSATRRIIFISAAVLAFSILVMLFYSRTITRPLKALTGAAESIEEGNYQVQLEIRSRDEIGALTNSFIAMGRGLANFERFTNKSIVALARKGKLGRTGEKKTVTVCFSLIKDFAGIAGDMSPKTLVGFVNYFLAHVVPCVTKTGGMVDKFLTQSGVVVMALWGAAGVPNPAKDAYHCICSALMMRNALRGLNLKRKAQGRLAGPLMMGCGINTGEVIAGQMGSDERMEYTVIGDTVNLAARIEEPNEEFDTDILITENTWRLIGKYLLTEEMPGLEVKGKSEPLRVFSVVNIRNYHGPATMEEVRKLWRV